MNTNGSFDGIQRVSFTQESHEDSETDFDDTILRKKRSSSEPVQYYYPSFSQNAAAQFLKKSAETGVLGSGQAEQVMHLPISQTLLKTIPYTLISVQAVWSMVVTVVIYLFADKSQSSFTTEFWTSRFSVPASVSYGLGWALFVLLGFYIQEASQRYTNALATWARITERIMEAVRHIVQVYPSSTWHHGDTDRIIAHLVAYPITLKMMLRGEREREQIAPFLHPDDVDDVLATDAMHVHCLRVVRAYLSAAEDDAPYGFTPNAKETPAGWGTRFFVINLIDSVDDNANAALRISNFQPSIGYVNHLNIFYFIWMSFLPLALVKSSGWFTVIWSVLISYGVGMMLVISNALNEPYGFDIQDIRLNRLAAASSLRIMNKYFNPRLTLDAVIDPSHSTPFWLEFPVQEKNIRESRPTTASRDTCVRLSNFQQVPGNIARIFVQSVKVFRELSTRLMNRSVLWPLVLFVLWITFIALLTRFIAQNQNEISDELREECRWWCLYLPIDTSTTNYVSLGLFLLLGYWLSDAYDRYWSALMLWQKDIRSGIDEVVFQFSVICKAGLWHHRDRERLFSFLAALPYVCKMSLRGSRDLSELEDILAPNDIAALEAADNMRHHCLDVIYGYCNSADSQDSRTLQSGENPLGISAYSTMFNLWEVEKALQECETMKSFPISKSFTAHLGVFTALWLAILPISTIRFDGFLSFVYLIPIGYSIVNLIVVGKELSDPFGYDKHDLPLDIFCQEMKDSIHNVYQSSLSGPEHFVHFSEYSRDDFSPSHSNFKPGLYEDGRSQRQNSFSLSPPIDRYKNHFHDPEDVIHGHDFASSSQEDDADEEKTSRFSIYFRQFIGFTRSNLPSVKPLAQIMATAWAVLAVFMSYGLSFTWGPERRNKCGQWCSPIDVDSSILENTGFALFMILTFRASDAMGRYEEGAILLYDMEMHLRNLAVEIVQSFNDGTCHQNDKERVIAHIIQIPLCFRDLLLKIERTRPDEKEGFLSEEDRIAFEQSPNPIEYLIQTVDAYILKMDSISEDDQNNLSDGKSPGSLTYSILDRVSKVRLTIAHALAVKRFPVVGSYTKHQQLFMGLWLALLPLGMAPEAGWFTILWAPMISYGVFGLEDIATKLVDPFGLDDIDIPVEKICLSSAHKILRAVHGTGWDCRKHVGPSPRVDDGDDVTFEAFARFDSFDAEGQVDRFGEGEVSRTNTPVPEKETPSIYSHFLRSVPWWTLLYVTLWSACGVAISYSTRRENGRERWWESRVSIDSSVSTYVSFAAFTLLGFYVEASFTRYNEAGIMWTDSLRSSCHALATQWFTMFEAGTWHENDHTRVIGHIAALPLIVKCELRGGRDLAELKGLLSNEDVGRILNSAVMSSHCLDVIRSYFITGARHTNRLSKHVYGGHRLSFVQLEIRRTEETIRSAMFLKMYAIAPGFIILLNMLIATWFFLLPFVLAETSGWFTIMWIPLIAYGVLGVYSLANELQQPFGYDLNDLDLNVMANEILQDVLFVQKHYRRGISSLVENVDGPNTWWHLRRSGSQDFLSTSSSESSKVRNHRRGTGPFRKVAWNFSDAVKLARHAIGVAAMIFVSAWTAAVVAFTWWLSDRWTSWNTGNVSCAPWWCSPIAVDESVKEYVGFALFLLLGFRLYDSHWRYVEALRIWQEGIIGNTRLLTNRLFESYPAGTWHEGDLERIAGHVAGFAIVTVGGLREISKREELLKMLGTEDVRRIETADDAGTYCIDVVRAYIIDGDRLRKNTRHPCGSNVHWILLHYITMLGDTASECERMIRIAVPFGYVQHLRIFMYVYLLMLPFGLVEETGWVSIVWVSVIAYGVLGVEHWAEELANPFGFDVSDVPLDELCQDVVEVVRENLHMYEEGTVRLIRPERVSFPNTEMTEANEANDDEIHARISDFLEEGVVMEESV